MGVLDEARELATWWDGEKEASEKVLMDWVGENPHWWAIAIAGTVQTTMDIGQGYVDILRIGEGVEEGTASGYARDGLRVLAVAGPIAKAAGKASNALKPLLRSRNLRVATQVRGVEGPCTFQAVNNALSMTRRKNLFVTVADMASALGRPLSSFGRTASGTYRISAWVDDLLPMMRAAGARVKEVRGLSRVDEVITLAGRESGPVIFAIRTTVQNGSGVTKEILHTVIAFRAAGGSVRFADYGGRFANTLEGLVRRLGHGVPMTPVALLQRGVSAAVVDGARFTGEFTSKLAAGSVLVLPGLAAIETNENGVEMAVPVKPVVVSPREETPDAVLKGSYGAFKKRKQGDKRPRLSRDAVQAGRRVAPPSPELKGVQFRLNALGFGAGPVDGIMGPLTRGAVTRFQTANHPPLTVDGIPGPDTKAMLATQAEY